MIKQTNAVVIDACTKRLHALKQYVTNPSTPIAVNGQIHPASDVVAVYQESLDARAELGTLRAQVKAAMARRATAEARRREVDRALKPWVANQFGADSEQAHDFGFPPPRTPVMTAEARAHAVALAKATREARHTMGPKQKARIKGVVAAPDHGGAPALMEAT